MKETGKVYITNKMKTPFILRGVLKQKKDGNLVSSRTDTIKLMPNAPVEIDSDLWNGLYRNGKIRVYRALVETKRLVITSNAPQAAIEKGGKSKGSPDKAKHMPDMAKIKNVGDPESKTISTEVNLL